MVCQDNNDNNKILIEIHDDNDIHKDSKSMYNQQIDKDFRKYKETG